MTETGATMTAYVHGAPVETPATIAGIRETLAEDRVEEFDREVAHTPALQLAQVLIRWALPQEAKDEQEELFAALERGDFSRFGDAPGTEAA
ncbi:hypothetical protein [Streptomyces carpaticus]|uniref:Uncharacterized protein n=1 Tax=Streptomyces carpaticus TaxID=285558 RepID=A0ABV4ZQI7_9ACTN